MGAANRGRDDETVAQLVEQQTFNLWVLGSSPSGLILKPFKIKCLHCSAVWLWGNGSFWSMAGLWSGGKPGPVYGGLW